MGFVSWDEGNSWEWKRPASSALWSLVSIPRHYVVYKTWRAMVTRKHASLQSWIKHDPDNTSLSRTLRCFLLGVMDVGFRPQSGKSHYRRTRVWRTISDLMAYLYFLRISPVVITVPITNRGFRIFCVGGSFMPSKSSWGFLAVYLCQDFCMIFIYTHCLHSCRQ
ncbi:hypothetical protein V8F06_009601 [Rhypophila decipiens]